MELKQSAIADSMYTSTGTPIHPMSPLLKITWLRKNDEQKFKLSGKFLSIKSYIVRELTGEYMIDYSVASATGMMNIHNIAWDEQALNFAGITSQQLPDLVPVFAGAGTLKKAYQNFQE